MQPRTAFATGTRDALSYTHRDVRSVAVRVRRRGTPRTERRPVSGLASLVRLAFPSVAGQWRG